MFIAAFIQLKRYETETAIPDIVWFHNLKEYSFSTNVHVPIYESVICTLYFNEVSTKAQLGW